MLVDMFFDMSFDKLFDMVINMSGGMLIVLLADMPTAFSRLLIHSVHPGVQPCR